MTDITKRYQAAVWIGSIVAGRHGSLYECDKCQWTIKVLFKCQIHLLDDNNGKNKMKAKDLKEVLPSISARGSEKHVSGLYEE